MADGGALDLPGTDLGRLRCLLAVEAGKGRGTALDAWGQDLVAADAQRGEALCCPDCGGVLVLDADPKGSLRFLHEADEGWRAAAHAALGRLALTAATSAENLLLPALVDAKAKLVRAAWLERFDALRLAPPEDGVPPHLLATKRLRKDGQIIERHLALVPVVSRADEAAAKAWAQGSGVSAVAIDLSHAPRDISEGELREFFVFHAKRRWLSHPTLAAQPAPVSPPPTDSAARSAAHLALVWARAPKGAKAEELQLAHRRRDELSRLDLHRILAADPHLDRAFEVEPVVWRTAIVGHFILDQGHLDGRDRPRSLAFELGEVEHHVRRMAKRELLQDLGEAGVLAKAKVPDFGTLPEVLERFMETMHQERLGEHALPMGWYGTWRGDVFKPSETVKMQVDALRRPIRQPEPEDEAVPSF